MTLARRTLPTLAALVVAMGVSGSAAAANVNFVGTWGSDTILTENMATGACTGTTSYGAGYSLSACQVSGDHYSFTVNYGSSYHSYNTGTITGNTIRGQFHDTNGTTESYTATRSGVAPVATTPVTTTTTPTTPAATSPASTTPADTTTTSDDSNPALTTQEQDDDDNSSDCESALDDDDPGAATNSVRRVNGVLSLARSATTSAIALSNTGNTAYSPNTSLGNVAGNGMTAVARTAGYCLSGAGYVVGNVVEGAGAVAKYTGAVVTAGALALSTPLTGSVGAPVVVPAAATAAVGYVADQAGEGLANVSSAALSDPPDPNFRHIATPAAVRNIVVPAVPGASRTLVRNIARIDDELEGVVSLSDALRTAVNRAGGAIRAKNAEWEGRQIRAALSYDRELRVLLHKVRTLLPTIGSEMSAPAFHMKLTASNITATKKLAAAGKLNPTFVKDLAAFGVSKSTVKQWILKLPVKATTFDASAVFTNPNLISLLKFADAGLGLWAIAPQIKQEAALR